MLRCRKIGRLVATDELREAGSTKRPEVRLYHLMCRHCHRYADQLQRLGLAMRNLWSGPATEEELEAARRVKERRWTE